MSDQLQRSESINELATALAKAQGEFQPAKMNAVNPFLKNHYADLGSIIGSAKSACAKYGLAVAQPATAIDGQVTVTTLLMHQSGQWLSSEMTLPLLDSKNMAQAAGSIITYLRRYSIAAMLGIYADEDTDGEKQPAKQAEVGDKQKQPSNNGHEPDPEQPAIPEPVMAAMERKGRDGRKYGELTDDELNTKINDLLDRLDAINDQNKRKPIETAIKQCETILEYRNSQGIAA